MKLNDKLLFCLLVLVFGFILITTVTNCQLKKDVDTYEKKIQEQKIEANKRIEDADKGKQSRQRERNLLEEDLNSYNKQTHGKTSRERQIEFEKMEEDYQNQYPRSDKLDKALDTIDTDIKKAKQKKKIIDKLLKGLGDELKW